MNMTVAIDHVILTRFNLPTPGPESIVRAKEGWLRNRVELFERHTVPTMRAQTVRDFTWIIYFDPESPTWLRDRLRPLVEEGLFTPIYRETATWEDVVTDSRDITGEIRDLLLTTNLDNDDAVAVDFVERLQRLARAGNGRRAIYLANGLVCVDDRAYLRRDPANAFCSVSEPWDGAVTAWRDWHILLHKHMPVVSIDGPPAWLQIVHGGNVSNRLRGRRVDPTMYQSLFAGQLDAMAVPKPRELLVDAVTLRPLREGRELVRTTGRKVVLRILGKGSLDTIKESIRRIAHR
ncbi:glycosyltransferase [Microbacterium deminutum]|uniref:Rhamnosyltransferase n=1 Tax=Microbacterium deminutum TaxID=344164 RepID=A0ABN2QKB3_9MICO